MKRNEQRARAPMPEEVVDITTTHYPQVANKADTTVRRKQDVRGLVKVMMMR